MSWLRRSGKRDDDVTCRHGFAIGLDVGATGVRVAIMSFPRHDGVASASVDRIASAPLPVGTVVDGAVVDPDTLSAVLRTLWKQEKFTCRNVIVGVAGPQVQVRELQMPDVDPAQRARALPFQARDIVAMPLDQVVLDFTALGVAPGDAHLLDGLLVVSPREPVTQLVRAVEAAGLRVARVDLSSFAVLRAAASSGLDAEVVVDLGADLTTVVVHAMGVPALVRTLPRGGADITRRLAERLRVDLESAESMKCREGLTGAEPTAPLLRELVTPLLNDIRTSINYFRSGHAGVRIDHVSLTGGGALMPGLAQAIEQQVGLSTTLADSRLHLDASAVNRKKPAPDLSRGSALCLGLAMGAAA